MIETPAVVAADAAFTQQCGYPADQFGRAWGGILHREQLVRKTAEIVNCAWCYAIGKMDRA